MKIKIAHSSLISPNSEIGETVSSLCNCNSLQNIHSLLSVLYDQFRVECLIKEINILTKGY